MKHTAMVFRFLDKCVSDLDTPSQVIDNFRLATKIHAIQVSWGECAQTDCDMAVIYYYSQGLGIKDFKIIKGDIVYKLISEMCILFAMPQGLFWSISQTRWARL